MGWLLLMLVLLFSHYLIAEKNSPSVVTGQAAKDSGVEEFPRIVEYDIRAGSVPYGTLHATTITLRGGRRDGSRTNYYGGP